MGKVSDARKEREVEIAKTRAKPVGPVVRKQRIVLGPGFRKLSVKASITSSNASLRCDQWRRKCAMNVRQLSRVAPTRSGAISIWLKDWYQISLRVGRRHPGADAGIDDAEEK